jgi:DNA-directed RNA polymerase subunit M
MFPKDGVLVCKNCGSDQEISDEDKKTITETGSEKEIAFIDDEKTLPTTQVECEKCGHNTAYYVIRQMRAADEPETMIYKCTKCGHKWRR